MRNHELNRRDFTRLSAAAFGGLMAGSMAGCGKQPAPPAPAPGTGTPTASGAGGDAEGAGAAGETASSTTPAGGEAGNFLLAEKHACRGLNMCKGQGAGGDNACAGQGECATIEHHTCAGQNACKGQGGCGQTAGNNDCSGKGNCAVPMHAGAWDKARETFEGLMKAKGKEVGAAPEGDG